MQEDQNDTTPHIAVVNHEEQYSVWPADRPLPAGWRAAGKAGTRAACLAWIGEVWTDMRPLSARQTTGMQDPRP